MLNGTEAAKRYGWVAVVLSLMLPGLGQIYCGRLARGLLLACLGALVIPVTAAMVANDVPVGALTLGLGGLFGLLSVTIIAGVDAFLLARTTQESYVLKEYNQLIVYVLLFALGKGGALGALLYTRDHLLEAYIVPSESMSPTIARGDRVLGNKTAYAEADPQPGEIVIFRAPENWRRKFVKRIVAVAGDSVETRDGQLLVNGTPRVSLQQTGSGPSTGSAPAAGGPLQGTWKVPAHHCFMLGDNPAVSRDSRHFGPVPLTSIIARADYLYWPADGWSRFGRLER